MCLHDQVVEKNLIEARQIGPKFEKWIRFSPQSKQKKSTTY